MDNERQQIRDRSFAWLNVTQFLGALNDNIYKLLITIFLIKVSGKENAGAVVAIAGAVFVIPFLLFSHAGGVLADWFSKRTIIVATKALEVFVMLMGLAAFFLGSPPLLYVTLFLMAMQSALFGPSKYGIIPEVVDRSDLSRANSLIVAFTFLAIIIGTPAAGLLSILFEGRFHFASVVCVLIALIGFACSLGVKRTPPAGSESRFTPAFLAEIYRSVMELRRDGYLFLAVLGSSYFMLVGAFIQMNIIPYGLVHLGLSEEASTQLFLVAAFGIGFGSWLAGRLSGRNIEFGVVPLGALGVTLSSILMNVVPGLPVFSVPLISRWIASPTLLAGAVVLVMGVSGGMFIVPLDAFIQFRAPEKSRGKVVATSNFLGFAGVFVSAGIMYFLIEILSLTPGQGFMVIGLLTLGLTILTFKVLPDFFLRFVGLLLMKLGYRIRVEGAEHVPIEGPALLICNHVSWVDAILLMATQQRRIRFIMYREIYEIPLLRPLFRLMGNFPISWQDPPRKMLESLREARAALDDGWLVCIFAEGQLTRTGNLAGFGRGFEYIMKNSDYPIIPIYLGGAWGSILSYYHGKLLSRFPSLLPYRITVIFGEPMPATSRSREVRRTVMELSARWFELEKPRREPLGVMFVRAARKNWFRGAMSDTTGKSLTYGRTLLASLVLSRRLKSLAPGKDPIGILLPASLGAGLSNLATLFLGRTPVNLNFTASESAIQSAVTQCGIRTVVTSRTFLKKYGRLGEPEGALYLEDILPRISTRDKVLALLRALFLPAAMAAGTRGIGPDDTATIIFSSGSTGEPRGVMLSHHNIISNIEGMRMLMHPSPSDHITSPLPLFHSFGFTATLWFPLLSGFSVTWHSNPLDGAKIAEVVRERRSTILLATPTFLDIYARKAEPADFSTLKWVIVGAEKLRRRIAEAFEKKFGIMPFEGYGATELSPVVSFNLPDVEAGGSFQPGHKIGSVGHPIPGISCRIVDPESGRDLSPGEAGLLLIKGPGVMKGYLNRPDLTEQVLKDGWYETGDIASLDEDGFITISDRLSRFSKISGEMVPHLAVEEEYLKETGTTEPVLAVTSVPDDRKGERLVVLFTEGAGTKEALKAIMDRSPLPNLWKPSPDSCFQIEALPMLGSGKLDLKELRAMALKLAGEQPAG
ncbi:MAG TPA: acyl-[ACP]--phospholipid O-acyltransferase [Candidatus Sumerlaeota bacterium]|nr:acyl-[ACP]--phospholipid O-acyltransferase [Candidatus Sumerlaeota bacterium]